MADKLVRLRMRCRLRIFDAGSVSLIRRTLSATLGNYMITLTASEARANLYRLIDQTVESHEPIVISGKRNSPVLISVEDWSAIQEILYSLTVPGMRESIKEGMAEALESSATSLDW